MTDPSDSALAIAVCVKFTPDVNALRPDPQTHQPDLARAPIRISDFDENALEEAVRLKERHGGVVTAISLVHEPPPRDVLLKALAMGVDEFFLVRCDAIPEDPALVAEALGAAVRQLPAWRLVLCGEGSVDSYSGQIGPRLAEILSVPSITYSCRLEVGGGSLRADRMLEDRIETVECAIPAVVTVSGEINAPRLPSVLQILGAGRKPVSEIPVGDLLSGWSAPVGSVRRIACWAPPASRRRITIEGESPGEIAETLLRALAADGVLI
jgi:electron transfer flavoprotein beta subunit